MNRLLSYIKAIHQPTLSLHVLRQDSSTNSYLDDEIRVHEQQTLYYFENGVVIRYLVERDDQPSEQICEECWISYEVVEPAQLSITPTCKRFHNRCQEKYWLKIQGIVTDCTEAAAEATQ
ncbi:hypothetical protein [Dongshaea marina]|uniref:hypothetical protein n=1 Tax=Dongshaea marina TaxID=2047966 RepID=UPI000D3E2719|nr:hypothetical protein [Dongshaea marina]